MSDTPRRASEPGVAPRPATARTGATWTVVVALVWVALALWRPNTTWHLAPVLLAAAWPWVTGQDLRTGDRRAVPRLLLAGAVGLAAATIVTLALSRAGLLTGPTIAGTSTATVESLVFGAAAACLIVAVGLLRVFRTPAARSAWLGSQQVASSPDVVVVEGNAYYPPAAVRPGALTPSATTTVCPWKGVARYYHLSIDGAQLRDAAWCYRHPLPFARQVKNRIAFEPSIETRIP